MEHLEIKNKRLIMDKYIVGLYDDEVTLLKAVKEIREKGIKITESLTPFPVHGLDEALGMKDSRLHTVGFVAGLTGTITALSFMTWVSISDYPTIFGGKPYFSFPAFIPITFEITVLFSAVAMVIAFFVRCGLSVFKTPKIYDERTTDYLFALTFEVKEDTTKEELERINKALTDTGVVEIKEKDFDEDEY